MRDHELISINSFMGLYDRGIFEMDACPLDHAVSANNVRFSEGEVQSRYGTSLTFTGVTNIVRTALYKRIGEATRLLILDNAGNLYDSSAPSSPILTLVGMTDFKMQNFFGRAYITPIDSANGVGLSGAEVYVYDGTGTARKAAGSAPTGTLTVTASALSGNVEAGFHLYAIAFETSSGFITKPGPAIYGILESDGTKQVELSGIPTGPTGTVKRHILATKAIVAYDGNQNGYEFSFIPNAAINDNTTTTATLNFFDADLFASAEYLFDQYEEIPAGAGITEFKGRLVVWNENYLFVSKPGEPESIDALVGLVLVGPGEAGYVTDCVEYRELLYINKKFRTFVTSDNGSDPASWVVSSLDKGTGCSLHGVIKILDAQGVSTDKFILASYKGLILYNGVFNEPELSWKIADVWSRINKNYFHLVHGYCDPVNHCFYVAIPYGAATSCNYILYADYSKGLTAESIRWSIWSSTVWNPTSILVDLSNNAPYLRIASTAGIYDQSSSLRMDADQGISSTWRTASVFLKAGYVHHCGAVRLRASGNAALLTYLYSEDAQTYSTLAGVTLSNYPDKDYTLLGNMKSEKVSFQFNCTSANSWFSIRRIDIYLKTLWTGRPI